MLWSHSHPRLVNDSTAPPISCCFRKRGTRKTFQLIEERCEGNQQRNTNTQLCWKSRQCNRNFSYLLLTYSVKQQNLSCLLLLEAVEALYIDMCYFQKGTALWEVMAGASWLYYGNCWVLCLIVLFSFQTKKPCVLPASVTFRTRTVIKLSLSAVTPARRCKASSRLVSSCSVASLVAPHVWLLSWPQELTT